MSGHCFTHPGCWVKVPFLLLWQTKGDDSYTLLWLMACSVGSRVSRRTSLMVLGEKLEGFTQCVIPSEKDVGCVCERERERGWISSCQWWLWASCFLFSNLYINTVHLISLTDQKRQSGGCSGSRRGLGTGYECVCVRMPEGEMLLRRIYRYYGLGGVILFTSRTLKQEAA